MSAAPSFTFRCYQCNKLLRVGRAKAGAVVACPKCAAELLVPTPADPVPSPQPAAPQSDESFPSLGPESVRLEPSVAQATSPASAPPKEPGSFLGLRLGNDPVAPAATPAPAESAPSFFPQIESESVSLRAEAPSRRVAAPAPAPPLPSQEPSPLAFLNAAPAPASSDWTATIEAPPPSLRSPPASLKPAPAPPPEPSVFPPIPASVEPPSLLSERSPAARRNDVALPRTAVVLWSFFALVALVLAFTAGLLAGHFLWKPH